MLHRHCPQIKYDIKWHVTNLFLITSAKPQLIDSIVKMIPHCIQPSAIRITAVPDQILMINYCHVAGEV